MQKETNMAAASKMTCKISLIWRYMKPSISQYQITTEWQEY